MSYIVLILILMEHAQRVANTMRRIQFRKEVLILILMEHAQRDSNHMQYCTIKKVLILILMEHAQRDYASYSIP